MKILDKVWCEVDVFVSDPKLLNELKKERIEDNIDETELRKRIKKSLGDLKQVSTN